MVNESIVHGHSPLHTDLVYYPIGASLARHTLVAGFFPLTFAAQVSSGYVATKIGYLRRQVASQKAALQSIDQTISILRQGASSRGLSTAERLIIASQLNGQTLQRSQVVDQLATYQNQLTLAQTVEQSKIFTPASAFKTTARSRRNSALVGGLIGLLLGIVAALLWEPVAGRLQKHP